MSTHLDRMEALRQRAVKLGMIDDAEPETEERMRAWMASDHIVDEELPDIMDTMEALLNVEEMLSTGRVVAAEETEASCRSKNDRSRKTKS